MSSLFPKTARRQTKRRCRRILFAEPLEMRVLLSAVPGSALVERLESTAANYHVEELLVATNPSAAPFAANLAAAPQLESLSANSTRANDSDFTFDLNLFLPNASVSETPSQDFNGSYGRGFTLVVPYVPLDVDSSVHVVDVDDAVFGFNQGLPTNQSPEQSSHTNDLDFGESLLSETSGDELRGPANWTPLESKPGATLIGSQLDTVHSSSKSLSEPSLANPEFGLTEPRILESPNETPKSDSVSPRLSEGEAANDILFTVDIAGMLSAHTSRQGPAITPSDEAQMAHTGALTSIQRAPFSACAYTSVDSPHQGRLRLVEIATDSFLAARPDARQAAVPVSFLRNANRGSADFESALDALHPSGPASGDVAPKGVADPQSLELDRTPSARLEPTLPRGGINWDRSMKQFVGRWYRYAEIVMSSVVAAGMVLLYQLKVNERDQNETAVLQFRRWYTAAFIERNRTSAAPNTSEK